MPTFQRDNSDDHESRDPPRTVRVPILTRVEGEGGLLVRIDGDAVRDVELSIYEPPRLFEALLRGRSFAEVAEAYERARPGHPPAVAEALVKELALRPGDPVLDLAAGTGKLTRSLLEVGLDVQAVEPLERFRAILERVVGAGRAHDGLAEAIPFADGTFAAVTVADAFHWFDQAAALAEIRRVVRPGGGLALTAVRPQLAPELGALVDRRRGGHPYFDGPTWSSVVAAAPGWSAPTCVTVRTRQALVVPDYVSTFSWVVGLPEIERVALLDEVRSLAGDEPVALDVHTEITLAARD